MSVWTEPGFMSSKGLTMPHEEKTIIKNGNEKKVYLPEYVNLEGTPEKARNFIKNWYEFADT